ncbi:MAG: beta-propeller domain-containing protein [Novosphingobium sp.]|nr:beta-propeller domain-containing protein [Novosphingobium sp.]
MASEASAPPVQAPDPSGITNVQTQGVDEGGIVKVHGTHLVVLRRGRLFTIDTSGGDLRPVAAVDAFAGKGGGAAWYDEMLVSGDLVIVIGYNYGRQGTEVNRFRIDDAGTLTFVDTHHLRSEDYYSSENYASRLIGTRLIVYSPRPFRYREKDRRDFEEALPGVRRWSGDDNAAFTPLATPRRVYAAQMLLGSPQRANVNTAHTVTDCDLARADLDCRATVVLGSDSRNFYVSGNAVYVWTADALRTGNAREKDKAILYRIPLDGRPPQAIGAYGSPIDQFSFLERDGRLNVLVEEGGSGEGMWRSTLPGNGLALLRLPLRWMGRGDRMVPASAWQMLPHGDDNQGYVQNRFVGDTLLYGYTPYSWKREKFTGANLHAVSIGSRAVTAIATDAGVTRIDAMGRDAIVIGNVAGQGLAFDAIDLSGTPRRQDRYILPAAREGENRSHAFFYRPDNADGTSGILGLPVATALTRPEARFLGSGSAIFFLNRDDRRLSPAGQLDADERGAVQDNCLASCTDWYGNARPIFLGDRIIALMGYELVEGRRENGQIREVRRINFAPAAR